LGTFIPKIPISAILGAVSPYLKKMRMVKLGTRVRTWESLPQAKFYKNRLRGKVIPKITNLGDLGGFKPTF